MIQSWYPHAKIELWAQDEARLGLVPTTRRVWSIRGQRPIALSNRRYEWIYLYGFVQPGSGRVWWLSLPTVSTEAFSVALEEFAAAVGAGPRKQILVVLDGAGWHTAEDLRIPDGIHLRFQPAYSPELQPSEHLWPLVNEAIANRNFTDLDELEETALERCMTIGADRELVRNTTLFHWWRDLEDALP